MEDKLSELYKLEEKDPDNEQLQEQIRIAEYEIQFACRTCGEPGERMYDCHNIYAGVYCSEKCCPLRLNYSQEDCDEPIYEDH
jgi:hypothetical protein